MRQLCLENRGMSALVTRVFSDDPDQLMPPAESHKKLNAAEKSLLRQWIADGATYSAPWAYVAPEKVPLPGVSDLAWERNWIDRFVLARLESEGVSPSPDADRVTLIRRLYFDLTGLPPEPRVVESFVRDPRDLQILVEVVVDDLLASPRFGERMAMYWLDLVRYADTVGYHGDQDHNIAPYRDWVVQSLNQNMPFDQFTREQLAGDLLVEATIQQRVASGYNRLLQTSHEGGIQKKEYDAIYAADRVRNVSAVWMGATMGCAQCHDHKYDPYTMKDFYSMAAFFADIHDDGYSGNSLPTHRPPEMSLFTPEQEAQIAELKRQEEELEREEQDGEEIDGEENEKKRKAIRKKRERLEKSGRRTMITVAKEPRVMRILPRGNWLDDSGEIVRAEVPEFLGTLELPDNQRASRLDLANWLTDRNGGVGGLTARVFANRFWYLFFGDGNLSIARGLWRTGRTSCESGVARSAGGLVLRERMGYQESRAPDGGQAGHIGSHRLKVRGCVRETPSINWSQGSRGIVCLPK